MLTHKQLAAMSGNLVIAQDKHLRDVAFHEIADALAGRELDCNIIYKGPQTGEKIPCERIQDILHIIDDTREKIADGRKAFPATIRLTDMCGDQAVAASTHASGGTKF